MALKMKKRCSKGKSCGATCISQKKVCISELPPEVRRELLKARRKIKASKSEPKADSKVKNVNQDDKIRRAYLRAWDIHDYVAKERKKYSWEDTPPKLKKSDAITDRRIRFLKELYHAQDRERYLQIYKEISKLQREIDKTDSMMKKYELFKKQSLLKSDLASAYFGEPKSLSKPQSDGGGRVDPTVPKLPKGGANSQLKDFLEGSELMRAFDVEGFTKFVGEGRARNGFEAGTKGMKVQGGAENESEYLKDRRKTESSVMNIPTNTSPKNRPIYGVLENPERSASLQGSLSMSQYGGVQVVFNSSVKDRSSFTIGDSLDDAKDLKMKASPVRDPAEPQINGTFRYGPSSNKIYLDEGNNQITRFDYVEAQIHGGVKLSDVKEVRLYRGNSLSNDVVDKLNSAGIKIVELPPRMTDLTFTRDIEAIRAND